MAGFTRTHGWLVMVSRSSELATPTTMAIGGVRLVASSIGGQTPTNRRHPTRAPAAASFRRSRSFACRAHNAAAHGGWSFKMHSAFFFLGLERCIQR